MNLLLRCLLAPLVCKVKLFRFPSEPRAVQEHCFCRGALPREDASKHAHLAELQFIHPELGLPQNCTSFQAPTLNSVHVKLHSDASLQPNKTTEQHWTQNAPLCDSPNP